MQVHKSKDCPHFYGLSVKISHLLHIVKVKVPLPWPNTIQVFKSKLALIKSLGHLLPGFVCFVLILGPDIT